MQSSGSIDFGRNKPASAGGSIEMNSPGEKINSPVETNTPIEIFEEEGNVVVISDDEEDALNARNKHENVNRYKSRDPCSLSLSSGRNDTVNLFLRFHFSKTRHC